MGSHRILALLDYLCSPEGLTLRRFGLPDVDYALVDGRPVSLLADGVTLYDKYPSYSLLRVLPNLDEAYMRSDPSLPAFAALLNEKCAQWEELCRRQQKHWTSLKANTILTSSGTYFNPNLTEISFRMLTAPEGVTRAFETAAAEHPHQRQNQNGQRRYQLPFQRQAEGRAVIPQGRQSDASSPEKCVLPLRAVQKPP